MSNIDNNEKSILINEIISIMYEKSAFKDIGMGKEILESSLKGYLESKTVEELQSDYDVLQKTVVNDARER